MLVLIVAWQVGNSSQHLLGEFSWEEGLGNTGRDWMVHWTQ